MKKYLFPFFFIFLVLFNQCTIHKDSEINNINSNFNSSTIGTGSFDFTYSSNSFNKILKIYYHIPENRNNLSKIVFVFHGINRNAIEYRNALIAKANQYNFILIVPEFSEINFPTSNNYNYGNVYQNGESPSPTTLNPESNWTFSIIEPLFDYISSNLSNLNNDYYLLGHSAGAQFAHRFLMFKPQSRASKTIISAAGLYTFPNSNIIFPYGFGQSILSNSSKELLYKKDFFLQVGALDNNPNSSNLVNNTLADAQGLHRLERATNFYNFCQQDAQNLNVEFNWNFTIVPNLTHDFNQAVSKGADALFN